MWYVHDNQLDSGHKLFDVSLPAGTYLIDEEPCS